jgi:hypothetical protein
MSAVQRFRLYPIDARLQDPSWTLSRYRGECRVVAESPDHARQIADDAFRAAGTAPPGVSPSISPWQQAGLVGVARLAAGSAGGRHLRGQVWCLPTRRAAPLVIAGGLLIA